MYNSLDDDNNSTKWICSICNGVNYSTEKLNEVEKAALSTPTVSFTQSISSSSSSMKNKKEVMILVVDGNLSCNDISSILSSLSSSSYQTREFGLVLFDKVISLYQLSLSGIASARIFAPGKTTTKSGKMMEQGYIGSWTVLLDCIQAYFGKSFHVDASSSKGKHYNAEEKKQEQQQQQQQAPPPSLSRRELLRLKREERLSRTKKTSTTTKKKSKKQYRCTGEAISYAIDLALSSSSSSSSARVLVFTNGAPNVGIANVTSSSSSSPSKGSKRKEYYKPESGDVIVDEKLGYACQYFNTMGNVGYAGNVGVDVFCSGSHLLGIQAYQSLVKPSDGYVLSFPTFTSPNYTSDIQHVLQTYMSRTQNYPELQRGYAKPKNDGLGLNQKSDFNYLNGVIVDVRMSSFLSPTHVIGPGTILQNEDTTTTNISSQKGPILPNEQTIFAQCTALASTHNEPTYTKPFKSLVYDTRTRIMLRRNDVKSTLSFMIQMMHDEYKKKNSKYAFFQFIIRHVNEQGTIIQTKVHTHRLPIALTLDDFINGCQEDVIPVLLGREAVYRCGMSRFMDSQDKGKEGKEEEEEGDIIYCSKEDDELFSMDARNDLDVTVYNISNAYRTLGLQTELSKTILPSTEDEESNIKNASTTEQEQPLSALDFAFPPELSDALRLLHHLRRGPMLGSGPLQSFDDRAIQRNLFLRLPLKDCIGMMAPFLWGLMIGGNFEFMPIPPETLALWDNVSVFTRKNIRLFICKKVISFRACNVLGCKKAQIKGFLLIICSANANGFLVCLEAKYSSQHFVG
uniref:Protein transport protein SEC23 n=1 Tax=Ditylum brightwellii TaxID=49249 RepID=A0A7S4VB00_9STRA